MTGDVLMHQRLIMYFANMKYVNAYLSNNSLTAGRT